MRQDPGAPLGMWVEGDFWAGVCNGPGTSGQAEREVSRLSGDDHSQQGRD